MDIPVAVVSINAFVKDKMQPTLDVRVDHGNWAGWIIIGLAFSFLLGVWRTAIFVRVEVSQRERTLAIRRVRWPLPVSVRMYPLSEVRDAVVTRTVVNGGKATLFGVALVLREGAVQIALFDRPTPSEERNEATVRAITALLQDSDRVGSTNRSLA
ncbi:MAG: hypothetical protein ABI461_03645 [Polyangiaceae bacterium]